MTPANESDPHPCIPLDWRNPVSHDATLGFRAGTTPTYKPPQALLVRISIEKQTEGVSGAAIEWTGERTSRTASRKKTACCPSQRFGMPLWEFTARHQ